MNKKELAKACEQLVKMPKIIHIMYKGQLMGNAANTEDGIRQGLIEAAEELKK